MPAGDEAFAWDRLREASDKIGPDATKLVAYKNTAAGYPFAKPMCRTRFVRPVTTSIRSEYS